MRPLIAITCIAILATIGYLGWGELGKQQDVLRVTEFTKHRQSCFSEVETFKDLTKRRLDSEQAVRDCLSLGYITSADLAR